MQIASSSGAIARSGARILAHAHRSCRPSAVSVLDRYVGASAAFVVAASWIVCAVVALVGLRHGWMIVVHALDAFGAEVAFAPVPFG
jgi:hypothetical protein